ncbi:hypothetical protein FGE12_29285 [Aggregicoccus sp. 17bor-14]|uniref:DUF6232 family protein n=1 Tax=Myxococcaceae TaxID=31 RepID=UPI00129C6874|nr:MULTISPECIES: DUF6232 family protein [Myxococcaceae]MBF5046546.1 hypothetical protein [Simulacricoccus sp. 17bor-14]MRI92257.1 hypothetical protein [Aggregicoccus sp. 17bor-14]
MSSGRPTHLKLVTSTGLSAPGVRAPGLPLREEARQVMLRVVSGGSGALAPVRLPAPAPRRRAPLPELRSGERLLLDDDEVLITTERFVVEGRTHGLTDVHAVQAQMVSPHLTLPLVVAGLLAAVALPLILSRFGVVGSSSGMLHLLLSLAGALLFAAVWRVAIAEDTYWVVLRTARGERRVYGSGDHQRVVRLVAVLDEAVTEHRLHG